MAPLSFWHLHGGWFPGFKVTWPLRQCNYNCRFCFHTDNHSPVLFHPAIEHQGDSVPPLLWVARLLWRNLSTQGMAFGFKGQFTLLNSLNSRNATLDHLLLCFDVSWVGFLGCVKKKHLQGWWKKMSRLPNLDLMPASLLHCHLTEN